MIFTVRSFGCAMRRALYCELKRQIPSLTVGIWRSIQITVFGTYQGASTIMRMVFDWKRPRISMLEVKAVPQSCIPYVQIGLSMAYR
jgi:hypothetical protein